MRFLWAVICWPEDHPVAVYVLFWSAMLAGLAVLAEAAGG